MSAPSVRAMAVPRRSPPLVGAGAYALLSLTGVSDVAPDGWLGLACDWAGRRTGRAGGLGGLVGDCIGARLQPCLPETCLRLLLGGLATGLGFLYAVQALA
ncbi:hypothetical protein GCM10023097_30800 [Streptomyces collinus]